MLGVPEYLTCDNAPNLSGHVLRDLCDKYQVKIWFTPVYSPQCNFVERSNKTVGTAIRCYIDKHTDWDVNLSQIRQAINTSKHEATKFTPCYLNYGRHTPLSGRYYRHCLDKDDDDIEIVPGNADTYASELQNLKDIFVEVRKNLHDAYKRYTHSYNLRKRDASFEVGQKVWRRNKVLSSSVNKFAAKLAPKYILCTVKKKLSRLVYRLADSSGTDIGNWHIKDLKPFTGDETPPDI